MKNSDIKINISISDKGDLIINNSIVIINENIMIENYVVPKSEPNSGYLYFQKKSGFQDIIGNGREITIFCNQRKYNAFSSKQEIGRISGLSKLFQENNIVESDKLRIQLLVNKEPLEMNIEKL